MDGFLEERVPDPPEPDRKRVESRSKTIRRENPEAEDPEETAEELLKESDARTSSDPATKDLEEDRVERRKSEDTTPPGSG
jgi:hypothetical protein